MTPRRSVRRALAATLLLVTAASVPAAASPATDEGRGKGIPAIATIAITHESGAGFQSSYTGPDSGGSVPSSWTCEASDFAGVYTVECTPEDGEYYCHSPYVLTTYFGSPLDTVSGAATCGDMSVVCSPSQNPLIANYCEEHRAGPVSPAPFTCVANYASALLTTEWTVRCRTYHVLPKTGQGRNGDDDYGGYNDGDSGGVGGTSSDGTPTGRRRAMGTASVSTACDFRADTTDGNEVLLTVTGTATATPNSAGATELAVRPVAVRIRCVIINYGGAVVFDLTKAESGLMVPLAGQATITNRAPYSVCAQADARYENGDLVVFDLQCMTP